MNKTSVINPFDQTVIGEIELVAQESALQKLNDAFRIFSDRSKWLSIPDRRAILLRLKDILASKRATIIATAINEGGKPLKDTEVEFQRGLGCIDIALGELTHWKGDVIAMEQNQASMHRHAYTIKEPRGVVLAISAFNHPFNLIIHQVIPCIATSCPVLIKPALKTPLTCKLVVDAIHEAGLPDGYCHYLPVENDLCEQLVANQKIAFMSFIGSSSVGWYLRSRLAPGADCTLEHGGNAPVILDRNIDFGNAITKLVRSSFYHAGQVCISTQRVYVHEEDSAAFLNQFSTHTKNLVVGDPKESKTDVGPLISITEVNRVASWVDQSIKDGGQLVCGGKRILKACYEPTIVFNPPVHALLSTEEIFGPVVAVYSYKTIDEALDRANESLYTFHSAIFTNRVDYAFRAATSMRAQTVLINDHTAFRVDWMPFGGRGQSGLGLAGIGYAMRDLSVDKMIVFNWA